MTDKADDSTILVPIQIEALVLDKQSAKDLTWKDMSVKYEGIWNRVSDEMEDDVLHEKNDLLEKGIHLHWALPAALRHGIYNGEQMNYPPVPNRWLVIRIQNENGIFNHKQWILESDFIDSDRGTSPWMTHDEHHFFSDTLIGRSVKFEKWKTESQSPDIPLTALGPGNSSFAANYNSCKNVFGFHDPMDDVAEGIFSYMVTGWYSETHLDPLHPSYFGELKAERLNDIKNKWLLTIDQKNFPSKTLCHCYIHSIEWNEKGNYANDVLSAPVNADVGNTTVESLSARMSWQTGGSEKILSAFQYDLLKDVSSLKEIQEGVHARQFTSTPGGTVWEIHRTQSHDPSSKDHHVNLPDFPDKKDVNLPELVSWFTELNKEQRKLDNLSRKKLSLQVEFRSTWDKMVLDENTEGVYQQFLLSKKTDLVNAIKKISGDIVTADTNVSKYKQKILDLPLFIGENDKPPAFELIHKQMPRFWSPKDPTVLLSGPGVKAPDKYKTKSKYSSKNKPGVIDCRVSEQLFSSMKLKDQTLDEMDVGIGIIFPLNAKNSFSENIKKTISSLFNEALVLDPNWSIVQSINYYKSQGRELDHESPLVKDLSSIIIQYLSTDTMFSTEKSHVLGLVEVSGLIVSLGTNNVDKIDFYDEKGIVNWRLPWTPLFLLWEIEWYPTYIQDETRWNYNPDLWNFIEGYDYQLDEKALIPSTENPIYFKGKTILSHTASNILAQQIENRPHESNINFLSQVLDGMNDSLLMKRRGIELPLFEYDSDENLWINEAFQSSQTHSHYFLPNTSDGAHFFPIRAGIFRINRLWVTDTFGQIQKIIDVHNHKITTTGTQHIAEELDFKKDHLIKLPPRIIQPSRLLFRWISANPKFKDLETNSNPETSPICGWIVPNHIDKSLMVFNSKGRILGNLAQAMGSDLQWTGIAGKTAVSNLETDITISELNQFISGILTAESSKDTLEQLLNLIEQVTDSIDTSGSDRDPNIAVLFGQPIALVRASIKLELCGLPSFPQGWMDGWTAKMGIDNVVPYGLKDQRFPVCIGDIRKDHDGVIGYFSKRMDGESEDFNANPMTAENNEQIIYTHLHPSYGCTDVHTPYFNKKNLHLSINKSYKAEKLTILMDARGGASASSGILPTKNIELPINLISETIKKMEMHFLVAPIISDKDNLDIPLPKDAYKEWAWINKNSIGEWSQPNTDIDKRNHKPKDLFKPQQIQEGYLTLKYKKE